MRGLAVGASETSGGSDHALFGQGFHHLFGGYLVGTHPVRIEPNAHGVLTGAEDLCRADARDSAQLGDEVDVPVVEEELHVRVLVRGIQVHIHQHVRTEIVHDHAFALNQWRQTAHDLIHTVHDVHRGLVGVGAHVEHDLNRCLSRAGRVGSHVLHVRNTVDGAFQRDEAGLLEHLGARARVVEGDHHHHRSHVRELGDRHGCDRQPSQEQNQQGDDDGQRRPAENLGKHGGIPRGYSARSFKFLKAASGSRNSNSAFSPGFACRIPSTTIRSLSVTPLLTRNTSSISSLMWIRC